MNGTKPTRARFLILSLLLVATMINYLDRAVLGIAAPQLRKELDLDKVEWGWVGSAFSWTYTAAQIPGGFVLDRLGVKPTYFLSVSGWSVFVLLIGFAVGFKSLVGFRMGLGAAEAPCFPANSRVLSAWFPQHERARATSIFSLGMYAGTGFLTVPLTWVAVNHGWRTLMIGVGVFGILFGLLWLVLYREPQESKSANQAELDHIKAGGGMGHPAKPIPFQWANLGFLLRRRQIIGAAIGQFAGNCALSFFLFWFIPYLVEERKMVWIRAGIFASLPWISAAVGCLTGGLLSDLLLRKTGSATLARKLPILCGFFLVATIFAASYVESNAVMITIMCIAFFGQGWINLGWTLITDVAPKKLFGLTTGLFNFITNLAAVIGPLVFGYFSYFWGLTFIACMALMGALSYIFLLGDVRRIEFQEDPAELRS